MAAIREKKKTRNVSKPKKKLGMSTEFEGDKESGDPNIILFRGGAGIE